MEKKMIDYDGIWSQCSKVVKKDLLNGLRQVMKNLENGYKCTSMATCLTLHLKEIAVTDAVREFSNGSCGPCEPCSVCSLFPELRPNEVQVMSIPRQSNHCPCMIFGREDAMCRLQAAIERLETEVGE